MARKNVLVMPDMTDTDDEGGSVLIPSGEYLMELTDVRADRSKQGNDMYVWKFRGVEKEAKGKTFYFYTVLGDNPFNLKRTTKALGIYEDGGFEVDPEEIKGTQVLGVVTDNTYTDGQGRQKTNSKLDNVLAVEATAAESTSKSPSKPTTKKGNGKKELAPLDADEVRKLTADELEDLVDNYKLNINLAKSPTLKSKIAATIQALDNAGMLEE